MLKEIKKITLTTSHLKTNALFFIPTEVNSNKCCIFTHGYTSHKGSILPWAQKMMDLNLPTIIFDLPGHFLGSFHDIPSFEVFKDETPKLFEKSLSCIQEIFNNITIPITGGHSLGALLSLIHGSLNNNFNHHICVGLGSIETGKPHLFQTPFFRETMILRSQLVSSFLHPDDAIPWIAKMKKEISTQHKSIYLIAGKDDIIIGGEEGVKQMAQTLDKNNQVYLNLIAKLPHHLPENAGIFVKKIIQQID